MIPTYRPSREYLRDTLASLLQQDIPADGMQIEVVDDASPGIDVATLVREFVGDRVLVRRHPSNLGLAGNWNACVQHARGSWVHILHQDDLVFPGFYAELRATLAAFPAARAAFTRHCIVDARGAWLHLSPVESYDRAVLPDWAFRLSYSPRVQCAAIVVQRSVYEELGGFRTDLPYCLDWEMWGRIAARFPVAHSPRILAGYRNHDDSETSRLERSATVILDQLKAFEHLVANLPPPRQAEARAGFDGRMGPWLMRHVIGCYVNQRFDVALETIAGTAGLRLAPNDRRELNRIARNIRLKRWLSRIGLWRPATSAA